MSSLRDRIAIVGVGASRQGTVPGSTALSLAVEAFRNALEDAGLKKDRIDGVLSFPGTTSPEGSLNYLRLAETLGIDPRFTASLTMGGNTAGALIHMAAMAVYTGMADYVACVFGDAAKSGGSRFNRAAGWGDSWAIWGMFANAANTAVTASRHMALYGTKSEHLAEVAVACRKHASLNPNAVMRKPITIADHQASRWIVKPLRLLDCCLISDGGVCLIVTSAERAKDLKQPLVLISGIGQGYTARNLGNPDWWRAPHQKGLFERAYRMAGLGPSDVDVAQLYDSFTINVLLALEAAGFCKEGESGPFVEHGRIQLGGELPVNTAGGNLSESYMEGWLHYVEGVRQLRGTCGERQVPGAEVCLVHTRGGMINCANATILRKG